MSGEIGRVDGYNLWLTKNFSKRKMKKPPLLLPQGF